MVEPLVPVVTRCGGSALKLGIRPTEGASAGRREPSPICGIQSVLQMKTRGCSYLRLMMNQRGDGTGGRELRSAWSPWATGVVAALTALPLGGAALLVPELRTLESFATLTQLVVFGVVMVAGVLLYTHFRATESDGSGWLALCLTIYSVQGATRAGLRASDAELFADHSGWILLMDLPVGVLILMAVRNAGRRPIPLDPIASGLVVGLLIALACVAIDRGAPDFPTTSTPAIVLEVLVFLVGIAIARAALQLTVLPRWCLRRMAVSAVLLVASLLAYGQPTSTAASSIGIATGLAGAVWMASGAAAALRWALLEQREIVVELAERMVTLEAGHRESRSRLHEITNSIAGIAVASSLIQRHRALSSAQRRRLEEMLESEAGRLSRVVGGGAPPGDPRNLAQETVPVVELDEVIRPLVTSHQALGRRVRWRPSGHAAACDPDAVAETINILLDNAARHAPGAEAVIEVHRHPDNVEIVVRDDGPGIPAEVQHRLFQWGGRGPLSRGQGIGLHLAHQLMASGGHSLRLDHSTPGTSFVIGLSLPGKESS